MSFEATIATFAAALADPAAPPPSATRGRERRPDARRFGVYRNNVAVGLIRALEDRYPVARRLVGDDFFRAMAGAFVAGNKPRMPVLIAYGGDFPDFIGAFEPARDLPYLPDVARLENAWVEAYHAAEGAVATLEALATLAPETLPGARLVFHPAVRLFAFSSPAASLWAGHQGCGEPRPPARWQPEEALVARPHADVVVRVLPAGGYAFAGALRGGASLAEAAAAGGEGFDPGPHLVGLIEAGAVTSIIPGVSP